MSLCGVSLTVDTKKTKNKRSNLDSKVNDKRNKKKKNNHCLPDEVYTGLN